MDHKAQLEINLTITKNENLKEKQQEELIWELLIDVQHWYLNF